MTDDKSDAREIDRVLSRASRISVPSGAQERLLARLPAAPTGNLVPLRPRRRPSVFWLPLGAALAACFAGGLLIGFAGLSDGLWLDAPDDETSIVGLQDLGDFLNDGDAS